MIRKVYRDDTMSDTQIKEWFKRFKDGRVSMDSDLRSGRPSTSRGRRKTWNVCWMTNINVDCE